MTDIVQLIATFGVLPVLIGACIVIIIYVIKSQHKFNANQQEMNKAQQEKNEVQEDKIMEILVQISKNTNLQHSKEEEEENRRVDEYVNQQLQLLLDKQQANRASCFLYHNGGRNVVGRSFQKMSVTHEVVDNNTVPMMKSYQQIPRMMFPVLNQKVAEQGFYYIENIEDIKEIDTVTYQSYYARGAKAVFIQAIKATNGAIMGFVALEYITNPVPEIKDLRHCLINKTAKISGALEVENATVVTLKE